MSVTITAAQALPGDIIRDRDGNLWSRQPHQYGQNFSLVYMFNHRPDKSMLSDGQSDLAADVLDLLVPLTLVMRDGQPVGDTLPEPEPPKIVEFEWAFHGNLWENRDALARELGFTPSDELLEKMGNPFYEVIVRFSVDTETGKVEILGAK